MQKKKTRKPKSKIVGDVGATSQIAKIGVRKLPDPDDDQTPEPDFHSGILAKPCPTTTDRDETEEEKKQRPSVLIWLRNWLQKSATASCTMVRLFPFYGFLFNFGFPEVMEFLKGFIRFFMFLEFCRSEGFRMGSDP